MWVTYIIGKILTGSILSKAECIRPKEVLTEVRVVQTIITYRNHGPPFGLFYKRIAKNH